MCSILLMFFSSLYDFFPWSCFIPLVACDSLDFVDGLWYLVPGCVGFRNDFGYDGFHFIFLKCYVWVMSSWKLFAYILLFHWKPISLFWVMILCLMGYSNVAISPKLFNGFINLAHRGYLYLTLRENNVCCNIWQLYMDIIFWHITHRYSLLFQFSPTLGGVYLDVSLALLNFKSTC